MKNETINGKEYEVVEQKFGSCNGCAFRAKLCPTSPSCIEYDSAGTPVIFIEVKNNEN